MVTWCVLIVSCLRGRLLCRNMVTSFIYHERIRTTVPRAKELRKLADKMVTHSKHGECVERSRRSELYQCDPIKRSQVAQYAEYYIHTNAFYSKPTLSVLPLSFLRFSSASVPALFALGTSILWIMTTPWSLGDHLNGRQIIICAMPCHSATRYNCVRKSWGCI